MAGLMAVLFAALGPAPEAWVYDRSAIVYGEWWRLLSGHWVHSDGGHLIWNLGALLVLGWVIERHNRGMLFISLLAGTLGVNLMLWLALPELARYCGLSGVLNTLLLFAFAALWRVATAPVLTVIGTLSFAKILVETLAGQALITNATWQSVPQAHLAGWLIGLVLICLGFASTPDTAD
jgi:rhomboid family GlyGly-CTERM serine protease